MDLSARLSVSVEGTADDTFIGSALPKDCLWLVGSSHLLELPLAPKMGLLVLPEGGPAGHCHRDDFSVPSHLVQGSGRNLTAQEHRDQIKRLFDIVHGDASHEDVEAPLGPWVLQRSSEQRFSDLRTEVGIAVGDFFTPDEPTARRGRLANAGAPAELRTCELVLMGSQ